MVAEGAAVAAAVGRAGSRWLFASASNKGELAGAVPEDEIETAAAVMTVVVAVAGAAACGGCGSGSAVVPWQGSLGEGALMPP